MTREGLRRPGDTEQRATSLELFYDLVFVLAVTQISHLLLDDLTWGGAGKATLVLLVVWWAWNYTTWVTNELDPDAVCSTFRSPKGRLMRPARTSPASSPSSHPAQNSRATMLFVSFDVTLIADAG